MSRKLKIANLILAILFMILYATLVSVANQTSSLVTAIVLLGFQTFQIVYAFNDFSKEGKTLWFVIGIIPNVLLICLALINAIQSLPSPFYFSTVILSLFIYLILILLILLHYLLVIVNKIKYWKTEKIA